MRILLLNQFFWPDAAATGQLLTDVARELAARGCSVTAVCGASPYAQSNGTGAPPAAILRAPSLPFRRSTAGRLLSYFTFLAAAAWHGLRIPKPDAILTLTTPPGLPVLGALLARLRGARHTIWEMDVYPDVAIALGVLPARSPLTRALRYALDLPRRHAAGIITLGECMAERLAARGAPAAKIHVAENWADGAKIRPAPFPSGPLTVLYSGNLGLAHEVHTVRDAILRLRSDDRFRFVFAGGGPARDALERFCRDHSLHRVSFRPYCDLPALGRTLAQGHLGLVTQKSETLGCVVPSKVYGIMAAGRPVLFIGPRDATPARILRKFRCGWHIDCRDVDGLIALLDRLARQPDELRAAGARARAAFEEHYDLPEGAGRICEILGLQAQEHVLARVVGA